MYKDFDATNHLKPNLSRTKFQSLNQWDFGWELLKPLNIVTDKEESEVALSRRFSPGQKALYFFWYLDAQVTNGGFIQFYWNGYRIYLAPILEGLKLIGDSKMLEIVQKADEEYLNHQAQFEKQEELDDWEPLYDDLLKFDELDSLYFNQHDETMNLIENYARTNTHEFVTLVE